MKLLLDENLSYRIISSLQEVYPGTTQVKPAGLECADDLTIWKFAKANHYVIVTKDDDFQSLLAMNGHPPKVIRLLTGNSTNQATVDALLHNANAIIDSLDNTTIGLVEVY